MEDAIKVNDVYQSLEDFKLSGSKIQDSEKVCIEKEKPTLLHVPFNRPFFSGNELEFIQTSIFGTITRLRIVMND
jgi:hypothetical protein